MGSCLLQNPVTLIFDCIHISTVYGKRLEIKQTNNSHTLCTAPEIIFGYIKYLNLPKKFWNWLKIRENNRPRALASRSTDCEKH